MSFQKNIKDQNGEATRMAAELTPEKISVNEFIASKQIQLFQDLKQNRFSGKIVFRDYQATEWNFILYFGRILYVTGGNHPVRRWRRNLAYYFPQIAVQLERELSSLGEIAIEKTFISWDYYLLSIWIEKQKIDREQATKMIRAVTTEVLFDITQARNIVYYLKPESKPKEAKLAMIDSEQQIIEAWKLWQEWQDTRIAHFSPNLAPVIKQPEVLKEKTSEKTYQTLTKLLDGRNSLRDLAIRKQTSLMLAARSMIPYIQLGFIELVSIEDLPLPIAISRLRPAQSKSDGDIADQLAFSTAIENDTSYQSRSSFKHNQKTLVACVETNPIIGQIVKKIVTGAGYNCINCSDYSSAIADILESKPDLIFINVELTEVSGYDLCANLRQLDYFNEIPIILFGKNISLVDRVKAKRAGCSELLNQPLEAKLVLSTIAKYAND